MVFSSLLFIFRFLPVLLLIYYLSPRKYSNIILLLGSLIFYSFGDLRFLLLLILSVIVNYFGTRMLDNTRNRLRRRTWLIVLLSYNFG
ncbi:MAG TPA: MBOAT family protein, partial [Lachnospiraceae bacterium]|nr:MBOAT family protein [Lachnospiraceae bacterium]